MGWIDKRHMTGLKMEKHLGQCRTNLADIMPNYGSDCTCGYRFLLELIESNIDDGAAQLTAVLNEKLSWTLKGEYR